MPFIQSAESLKSKMHMSDVSTPVLIGVLALAVIAIVLVVQNVAGAFGGHDFTIRKQQSSQAQASETSDSTQDVQEAAKKQVIVHVSGAVALPGVYSLDEGSRVKDAVERAGGFSGEAAQDGINLARQVVDGEQIIIPTQTEASTAQSGARSASTAATSAAAASTGLVNINTATAEQLETLPGIGAATAAKIIANREDEGPFQKKEDLKRVSGIGDKKYAALADLITTG